MKLTPLRQRILNRIRTNPGISQTELATQLERKRQVIYAAIEILSDAKLVRKETAPNGTVSYYYRNHG